LIAFAVLVMLSRGVLPSRPAMVLLSLALVPAAPSLGISPWVAGFVVLVAVAWANRRRVALLLALLAATIAVPVVAESTGYRHVGTMWQGRYILPLAVGIPILAAVALAATERGRRLATPRLLWTLGIFVGVAHVLAYAQNLRRYTVGYYSELQYWKDPRWSPPVSSLLITIAYAVAVVAFVAWLLAGASAEERIGDPGSATAAEANRFVVSQ